MIKNNQTEPEIQHNPLGNENPYLSTSIERQPRRPIAGQTVSLNALTSPAGYFSRLNVELWSEGDSDKLVIEAHSDSLGANADHWQAVLPDLKSGREYFYRFVGNPSSAEHFSDTYTFEVYQRVVVQDILSAVINESSLTINYRTSKEDLEVQLMLSEKDDQELWGQWNILNRPSLTTSFEKNSIAEKIVLGNYEIILDEKECILSIKNIGAGLSLQETFPCDLVCNRKQEVVRLRQGFQSFPNEAFYGFGERYNSLDQRGNILDNIAYDQWASQGKRTYFPVPFFMSSNHYGLFINTNRNVIFDICASVDNVWSYEAEIGQERCLTFQFWSSKDPKRIITRFTDQVGKPKMPPAWVFGLWMSSNSWNNQSLVIEEVEKSIHYKIPASVVVLESWSDETTFYLWNDSEYSPKPPGESFSYQDFAYKKSGKWPNPKEFVEYLNSLGIKLVLWQIPVIKSLHEDIHDYGPQPQHELDQDNVVENKYCLLNEDGTPYHIPEDKWFARSMMIDFTNPQAVEWWMNNRRYLVEDLGVAGFKTDGGEQAALSGILANNGLRGDELRNLYPKLYLNAYSDFLVTTRGEDWVLFSRSGYVGAQSNSCHWAGDQDSTWENYRACVYAGLNIGLAGVSFWGWDFGGFSNSTPSAELYLRSAAFAAFCPLMQFHSIVTDELPEEDRTQPSYDRSPWNIQEVTGNPEVIPIFRKYVNTRMNIKPYLINEAYNSSVSGLPMMRSVAIFNPEDETARKYPYQYFLGSDLLVAPVVEEGCEKWTVYLPEGSWVDFWTREVHFGSKIVSYPAEIDRIPVFIRRGAILPLYLSGSLLIGEAVEEKSNLCFQIFPIDAGSLDFFHQGQNHCISYKVFPEEQELRIQAKGLQESVFLLIAGTKPERVTSGLFEIPKAVGNEETLPDIGFWNTLDDIFVIRLSPKALEAEIIVHQ